MRRSGLEFLWQKKHGAAEATALPLGRFLPCDSPALSLPVADEWARRNGLPSLDDFLSRFQSDFPKPVKPSPDMLDDTLHRFPPDNPAHAKFFRYALEREELDRYFHNLRAYEAKTQEAERHCAAYSPDAAGYLKFLAEKDETLSRFFFESYRTLPIEEADRERHTYIVGGSGSGKTELIKVLLHHYLARNTAPALVVIDPHGDLSRQVARWPEFSDSDRLVYVAPGFGKGVSPVFNPFDIPDSERTEEAVSVLVDDTIDIVQELLEKDFTTNMGTLLQACFTILFYRPGSTFSDVLRFVDKKNNHDLLEVGERVFRADNPLLQFIRHDLASDSLGPTRQAVKMRFTQILSRHFFRSFLIGQRSTFRLEELLRQRKAVIFNLSKSDIGTRESRIFGKFIIAHLRAFAFKQGRLPEEARVPVHVFVDECQDFITESIVRDGKRFVAIAELIRVFGEPRRRPETDTAGERPAANTAEAETDSSGRAELLEELRERAKRAETLAEQERERANRYENERDAIRSQYDELRNSLLPPPAKRAGWFGRMFR
jgi:hypothetical protein